MSWTAPDNTGRPSIQSYDLQYRKGTTGNFADGPQDVTGLTDTISGLDADSLYQVQVRATNEDGDSAWSQRGQRHHERAGRAAGLLPAERLWSACLTAGAISTSGRTGYQSSASVGTLAPATFDVGTTTYTVTHLFDNDDFGGDTYVRITFSPVLSQDDAGNLTLHIGDDTSLSFGDATYSTGTGTSIHSWSRTTALGWSVGDAHRGGHHPGGAGQRRPKLPLGELDAGGGGEQRRRRRRRRPRHRHRYRHRRRP